MDMILFRKMKVSYRRLGPGVATINEDLEDIAQALCPDNVSRILATCLCSLLFECKSLPSSLLGNRLEQNRAGGNKDSLQFGRA